MFESHLSVLPILIPLLVAPLTAVIRSTKLSFALTLLVNLALVWVAALLLMDVSDGSEIHYAMGGWAPPWGIAYKIDSLNALMALIVSLMGLIATLYGFRWVPKEVPSRLVAPFYAAFQLCVMGLLGIALTGDIFNLFVFLEISSLSSYALISMGMRRQALTAAFQYLVMGTLGATFFLIGIGLTYAATGTLNMQDLAVQLMLVERQHTVHTAFAFIFVGLALKMALYPLHLWLPSAYSEAPPSISLFLAATSTKVSIYVLIRCLTQVFSPEYVLNTWLPGVLEVLAIVAIIYGSTRALQQQELKHMLAYSSVAQIGYIALGIALMTPAGLNAAILHLFNHALIKGALFAVVGIWLYNLGSTELRDLRGAGQQHPWVLLAFVLGGFGLIGVPGTAGFVSKWALLQAIFEVSDWVALMAVVIGSILALMYVWKVVEKLYFQDADTESMRKMAEVVKTPLTQRVSCWLLVFASLLFGLYSSLPLGAARTSVQVLLGSGP